jgi:peptide deformylase
MIKPITTYIPGEEDAKVNYAILTTPCEPINTDGSEDYTKLFEDMLDTAMGALPRCVGLSANQIGVHKRAILIRWGNTFLPMINPEIVKASPQTCPMKEGCLSLPKSKPSSTVRHKSVTVKFFDPLLGEERNLKLKGRDAVVVAHELDHLEGELI